MLQFYVNILKLNYMTLAGVADCLVGYRGGGVRMRWFLVSKTLPLKKKNNMTLVFPIKLRFHNLV